MRKRKFYRQIPLSMQREIKYKEDDKTINGGWAKLDPITGSSSS